VRETGDITSFMCQNIMKIWEPKLPGTLWATPDL